MNIETSLLLFLLLEGIGVGTLIAAATLELVLAAKSSRAGNASYNKAIQFGVWLGFAALVVGLAISLTHLGHPERFWLAYAEISKSWLSREGVFGVLTLIAAAVYSWTWIRAKGEAAGGKTIHLWIGGVVIVLGLIMLFSTSMIYASIRSIPLWNGALLVLLFLASALALGFFLLPVLAWKPLSQDTSLLGRLIGWCLAALIALIVVNGLTFVQLNIGLTNAAADSLAAFEGPYLGITLVRLLIGLVLPLVLIGLAIGEKRNSRIYIYLVGGFGFLLVGEILGKVLFFLPAIRVGI
jgi:DMSO reductase anchor subunit